MTCSQIRCLLAILALHRLSDEVASKDIAKLLGVSKPSVHRLLDMLCKVGLAEKEPYGSVQLTAAGQAEALRLEERRDKLILTLARHFGLPMDECSIAATLLISELREESLQAIENALPPVMP